MALIDDRYYHEMEIQKHCPICNSTNVALISRIDHTLAYGNIYVKYHCNDCQRDGNEFINSISNAWNQFSNIQL